MKRKKKWGCSLIVIAIVAVVAVFGLYWAGNTMDYQNGQTEGRWKLVNNEKKPLLLWSYYF